MRTGAGRPPEGAGGIVAGTGIMALGVVIAVPAAIGTIVDANAGGTKTERRVETRELDGEDHTPCSVTPLHDAQITLVLEDGTRKVAVTDHDGVARFALSETAWAAANGSLLADVHLDGLWLRRVTLMRSPP